MTGRVSEPTLLVLWYWSADVPACQLSIDLDLVCAYNFKLLTTDWQPCRCEIVVSFYVGKRVIFHRPTCKGKKTGLSSEVANVSCDICQRMPDWQLPISTHPYTDGLYNRQASVNLCKIKCDNRHRLTCGGCTCGRHVITKFSCIYGFPISRSARGGSANNNDDNSDNDNNDDNERDVCSWAIVVWSNIKHKHRW